MTWFLAWLTLDQRRIDEKKNALLPCCLEHPDWKRPPPDASQASFIEWMMKYLAKGLRLKAVQVMSEVRLISGFLEHLLLLRLFKKLDFFNHWP